MIPRGAQTCSTCNGDAIGRFPTFVELEGRYFHADEYEKLVAIGAEFINDNFHSIPLSPLLKVTFDGGTGLLLGIDQTSAERRVKS